MAVQVWVRNPSACIRECAEVGANLLAWDRGKIEILESLGGGFDPVAYADIHFGLDAWRGLAIGEQGTAELRSGYPLNKPFAVYPTWEYGQDGADLEELLASPVGLIEAACKDPKVKLDVRPVLGQEHRVVIIRPPIASSGPGRQLIRFLSTLQEDFPDAIIHVHGFYSWRAAFGFGMRSADIEPRQTAQKGKVVLPMGKEVVYERAEEFRQWVEVLGYGTKDLEIPRNRCMFNIKSALWAAEHYGEDIRFKSRGTHAIDPMAINHSPATLASSNGPIAGSNRTGILPGDKLLCDTCSLSKTCKYFRPGEVCSIPGAETASLAKFFKTRDSETIIDGLGALMQVNAQRLEVGASNEEMDGELDPEVTKIIKHMFDSGVKLAKLVDPALAAAGAPRTNILNVAGPSNLSSMTAGIVQELEARGHDRKDITPELIMTVMNERAERAAIPAASTVVEVSARGNAS